MATKYCAKVAAEWLRIPMLIGFADLVTHLVI